MAFNMNKAITRLLLMRRRGVAQDDALKYSLVLSANDSPQPLSATEFVVTDLIARRKAEEAQPASATPVGGSTSGGSTGPAPTAPVAGFAVDARPESRNGNPVLVCSFKDTSSGGQIDSRHWDFGDGQTSGDQSPTHEYGTQDTFRVTLTVRGPGGETTTQGAIVFMDPAAIE